MNVRYGYLADVARIDNGKAYVIGGGITILWRDDYPAPTGFDIVLALEHRPSEAGQSHTLMMQLSDADGAAVGDRFEGVLATAGVPEGLPRNAPLHALHQFGPPQAPVLPAPGMYAVEILLDGNSVYTIPFVVARRPAQVAEAA